MRQVGFVGRERGLIQPEGEACVRPEDAGGGRKVRISDRGVEPRRALGGCFAIFPHDRSAACCLPVCRALAPGRGFVFAENESGYDCCCLGVIDIFFHEVMRKRIVWDR